MFSHIISVDICTRYEAVVENKQEAKTSEEKQKKLKVEKKAFDNVLRKLVESPPIKRGVKRQTK